MSTASVPTSRIGRENSVTDILDLPKLPNMRKLFIPEPGQWFIDADFERADAAIVAFEADDPSLKQMIKEGADIHTENAKAIYGGKIGKDSPLRQRAKNGCHAVNYGVKERTLAATLGCTIHEAEEFMAKWFAAHPGIQSWHERIEAAISKKPYRITNIWGYHRIYFDRPGTALPAALAWIGQSAVAITINRALLSVMSSCPDLAVMLQVHDSLLLQSPRALDLRTYDSLHAAMSIPVPYPDPLTIGVSFKQSAVSWGDCAEVKRADLIHATKVVELG